MKVLVAGVGNVLRGDDGFGVIVAEKLIERAPPRGVRVVELGIGGIHLVQELADGYDALVVIDAVELGNSPGTVVVMRPDVLDLDRLSLPERQDQLADVHYSTPERAMMLAFALRRLPAETWLVGGEVADVERYGDSLSPKLAEAVESATAEVRGLVGRLGIRWD